MPGPTDEQHALLDAPRERDPETTFEWDDVRGIAAYVRSQFATDAKDLRPEGLLDVVREYAPLFGLTDPGQDVRFLHEKREDLDWNHVEYQQVLSRSARRKADRSIDVYG